MDIFLAEVLGTFILILLGDGVVAGVLLKDSKAEDSGWIVITFGWGMAVAIAVYTVGGISGAHINPAVTIGLWSIGSIPFSDVPVYLAGQFIGAFLGAALVWVHYLSHWAITADPGLKLAVFSTGPAVRNAPRNFIAETIGTAMLLLGVLGITSRAGYDDLGNLAGVVNAGINPLIIGLLVFSIGLSLGGPTGYAINPARDLGPRVAHAVLPIAGKGDSDWSYSWIPVVGPIVGGVLGAVIWTAFGFA